MKRIALALIVLLLAIAYGYADGYQAEEAVNREKERQLEKVAERFKAEAKFVGEINFNYTQMKLGSFEGKFADIPFSAKEDTTAFRQACERILDKILPYSLAKRSQLPMKRITRNGNYTETIYHQTVNGYRVENSGFIVITYDAGRYRFDIGDNTVELPEENANNIISADEAKLIAIKAKDNEHYTSATCLNIFYSSEGSDHYYLAYLVEVSNAGVALHKEFLFWIDATTGLVKKSMLSPMIESDIHVDVKGNLYGSTLDLNTINTNYYNIGIEDVKVCIANTTTQTNVSGFALINGVDYINQKVKLENSNFKMVVNPDTTTYETTNFTLINNDTYRVDLPDSNHYSPNAYITAVEHIKGLEVLKSNYFDDYLKIETNYLFTDSNIMGNFAPYVHKILLRDARLVQTVRHELSHHFVNRLINAMLTSLTDSTIQGMDEGLADYFGGSPLNDDCIPLRGGPVHLSQTYQVYNSGLPIAEELYSYYWNGIPLASAWWSLRNNQTDFPPDNQNRNGVDTLLVAGLGQVLRDININSSYRYKPRYFYNIMMSRVDDDNKAWPPNAKQAAIDKAYADRGFYFTPKVMSTRSFNAQKESDIFKKGDSIYVTISHCPQNTPLKIYIVRDQSYTDGMGFGSLAQNSIIRTQTVSATDIGVTGHWSGGITGSTTLEAGNYDILVDIGINGRFHFAYKEANILDGFDGLYRPGFTVYDYGDSLYVEDLNDIFEADLESDLKFVYTNIDFTKKFKKIEPDDTGVVFNGLTGATFCENADSAYCAVKLNITQYLYTQDSAQ